MDVTNSADGALVLIASSPDSQASSTLLVLRPRLIESESDYPFQTAQPLASQP